MSPFALVNRKRYQGSGIEKEPSQIADDLFLDPRLIDRPEQTCHVIGRKVIQGELHRRNLPLPGIRIYQPADLLTGYLGHDLAGVSAENDPGSGQPDSYQSIKDVADEYAVPEWEQGFGVPHPGGVTCSENDRRNALQLSPPKGPRKAPNYTTWKFIMSR